MSCETHLPTFLQFHDQDAVRSQKRWFLRPAKYATDPVSRFHYEWQYALFGALRSFARYVEPGLRCSSQIQTIVSTALDRAGHIRAEESAMFLADGPPFPLQVL